MSRRRIEETIGDRDPRIFAHNVRRARERLGWTRQRLGKEARVSPQTLTRVEAGKGCSLGVERKLSDALGTVLGRLWDPQGLDRFSVHRPQSDRWYFTSHEDGERFWRSRSFGDEAVFLRYDPDEIQNEAERRRMGTGGLSNGFVRITTAHLRAGSLVSSVIELYGAIDSGLPESRIAYFNVVRGTVQFHLDDTVIEVGEHEVLQAEMPAGSWLEPGETEDLPTVLIYVDPYVQANPNGGSNGGG